MENILYVLTSTPDGAPIETDLTSTSTNMHQTFTVHTDRYGLAEVRVTPAGSQQSLPMQAKAANGAASVTGVQLHERSVAADNPAAARRPIYRVGEHDVDDLTSAPQGTVYLDIVREGKRSARARCR